MGRTLICFFFTLNMTPDKCRHVSIESRIETFCRCRKSISTCKTILSSPSPLRCMLFHLNETPPRHPFASKALKHRPGKSFTDGSHTPFRSTHSCNRWQQRLPGEAGRTLDSRCPEGDDFWCEIPKDPKSNWTVVNCLRQQQQRRRRRRRQQEEQRTKNKNGQHQEREQQQQQKHNKLSKPVLAYAYFLPQMLAQTTSSPSNAGGFTSKKYYSTIVRSSSQIR